MCWVRQPNLLTEIISMIKSHPVNYIEPKEQRLIRFDADKGIAVVQSSKDNVIVSVVRRKREKKEWEKI